MYMCMFVFACVFLFQFTEHGTIAVTVMQLSSPSPAASREGASSLDASVLPLVDSSAGEAVPSNPASQQNPDQQTQLPSAALAPQSSCWQSQRVRNPHQGLRYGSSRRQEGLCRSASCV